jgi:hypothetical protein
VKISPELIEAIARLCHAANREWARAWGTVDMQPEWDSAPFEVKNSAIVGVSLVLAKPDITAEQLHEVWMASKIQDGWTVGPKDLLAKTHPCLVPYEQLNSKERLKDHVFLGIVRAFLEELE